MSRWRHCTVPGCLRPAKARGLCNAHYYRLKRGQESAPARGAGPLVHAETRLVPDKIGDNHQSVKAPDPQALSAFASNKLRQQIAFKFFKLGIQILFTG